MGASQQSTREPAEESHETESVQKKWTNLSPAAALFCETVVQYCTIINSNRGGEKREETVQFLWTILKNRQSRPIALYLFQNSAIMYKTLKVKHRMVKSTFYYIMEQLEDYGIVTRKKVTAPRPLKRPGPKEEVLFVVSGADPTFAIEEQKRAIAMLPTLNKSPVSMEVDVMKKAIRGILDPGGVRDSGRSELEPKLRARGHTNMIHFNQAAHELNREGYRIAT